jgi:hypothetical protein
MDDIARDTYENSLRKEQRENIDNPNYEKSPSYEEYQMEREEILPDQEDRQSGSKIGK